MGTQYDGTGTHGRSSWHENSEGAIALSATFSGGALITCLVPLVLGLDQLLAVVRGPLAVKPPWLGLPPSTRVLLLFQSFLSLASFQDV